MMGDPGSKTEPAARAFWSGIDPVNPGSRAIAHLQAVCTHPPPRDHEGSRTARPQGLDAVCHATFRSTLRNARFGSLPSATNMEAPVTTAQPGHDALGFEKATTTKALAGRRGSKLAVDANVPATICTLGATRVATGPLTCRSIPCPTHE